MTDSFVLVPQMELSCDEYVVCLEMTIYVFVIVIIVTSSMSCQGSSRFLAKLNASRTILIKHAAHELHQSIADVVHLDVIRDCCISTIHGVLINALQGAHVPPGH